jgi:hypothetical protein
MNIISRCRLMAVMVICVLTVGITHAGAADKITFKNKNVSMIIGYRAGGSTDVMARIVAPYLAKYLPGSPTIVPRNILGAGGVKALNYFWQQSKPDGLTVNAGSGTQVDPLTYRRAHAVYDTRKLRIFGGTGRAGTVMVVRKEVFGRLTDKSQPPLIMAGRDAIRSGMMMAMWGAEYLGWNIRWVLGYRGSADILLALQRKEADMTSLSSMQEISSLMKTGNFALITQSGALDHGKLVARSEYDAPVIYNIVKDRITDARTRRAFDYWKTLTLPGQWFALPPATPDIIVALYRKAYAAAERDPGFKVRVQKIAADTIFMSVADTENLIRSLAETDNDTLEVIAEIQRKQGIMRSKKRKRSKH